MDEDRRLLLEVWRWLPVFRMVAETESVTRAARAFSVSPPAVSRALQQVEAAIGRRLFDRHGRRLALNPEGQVLLGAVRDAEERVATVIGDLGQQDSGHLRLATMGQLGRVFIAPAVRALFSKNRKLEVSVIHATPEVALERLKDKTVDLFLALNVSVGEQLEATHLGDLEIAVFAGRGHELFERSNVALDELEEHPFAAQLRPGLMRSVWPSEVRRKVSLETDSHAVALEACLSGSHLMAMERVIAAPFVTEGTLREVKAGFLPPARLVLCRHRDGRSKLLTLISKAIADVVHEKLRLLTG